jgi:hypothetical protein
MNKLSFRPILQLSPDPFTIKGLPDERRDPESPGFETSLAQDLGGSYLSCIAAGV